MKLKMNFYPLRWLAALLSCFTMVFSPLAIGKEAEKINKAALEKYIVELGLNKATTLGEFWDKSKGYIPGYAYNDLEAFVKQNRNMQLPEVTLDQSKSTDGFDVPVIKLNAGGRTQTLQFFGENKKWVRYNGVTLSANDLERVQDAFARIEASDIKLKKEADQYRKNQSLKQGSAQSSAMKKDLNRFTGFPRMTPQLWKTMTKMDRAAFLTRMRLLWNNARYILDLSPQNMKAPAKKSESAIQNFYKVIFGQPAEAAAATAAPPANPYTASNCVVAGYIGTYKPNLTNVNGRNRAGCSVDAAISEYNAKPNFEFVKAANDVCKAAASNSVACNPIIYGFPGGQEACISKTSREFQFGTHFEAPAGKDTCDAKSRLSSSPNIMAFPGRDYSAIATRAAQITAIEEDQKTEDYKFTKDFLDGVLAKKGNTLEKVMQGEWNAGFDSELVRIQTQFEEEIDRAIGICERTVVEGTNESNQKLACDQLHRRWLFTERFIAKFRDKACVKPAVYVGLYDAGQNSYADNAKEKTTQNKMNVTAEGTNLCACPAGEKVNFGGSCPSVPPAATAVVEPPCPTAPSAPAPSAPAASQPAPPVVAEPSCPPPASTCNKPPGISDFDYEKCACEDGKRLEQKNGNYVCEGKKNNWLPWVLGGGALILLFALFHRNKKPKTPPPVVVPGQCPSGRSGTPPDCMCSNTCPTGSTINPDSCSCSVVPEPPLCTAPMVGNPPSCSCPVAPTYCTPPQRIYDMSTCQCTEVIQPVVCPNGRPAPNGNLSLCNKCPSGAYEPAGGCPNEGGGGNNCPQGGCSGGLPGTGI